MSKKKDIIRVGDKVKILRPLFIYRWGYDNNLKDVAEEVLSKYKPQMREFVRTILNLEGKKGTSMGDADYPYYRLASALAYEIVGSRMSQGAIRKLFYITDEDKGPYHWLNHDFPAGSIKEVVEIKIVKTGRYISPGMPYYDSFSGEYDPGDPGYLADEKTHKLLRVGYTDNWIEATNVEKVNEDK
jgi:hypothetical protein